MLNLKIRSRLIAGFGAITFILMLAVGITIVKVNTVSDLSHKIVELRVPTSAASQRLVNDVNSSLAALRGWMLTGNKKFKAEREAIWDDIDLASADLDIFSQNWTNPDNVKKWQSMKVTLDEFRVAQKKVEDIAHTINEQPANKILFVDAAPKAASLIKNITKMIDVEMKLKSTPERKNLLGIMADVRGSTAISLANIRAYLLSGDKKFKDSFDKSWGKNIKRFSDLKSQRSLFSSTQKRAFNEFSTAHAEFALLPSKMFEIRASKKWNMANYLLITEAAPRAGKILNTLAGLKQDDGSRKGGMVANQKKLLNVDALKINSSLMQLKNLEVILMVGGLIFAVALIVVMSRSIVTPIIGMTGAMSNIAGGDLTTHIPALDKTDEIGEMAKSLEQFKQQLLRVQQLEEDQKKFEEQSEKDRLAALNLMADTLDSSVGDIMKSVASATVELQESSVQLATAATETSQQASSVSSAATQTSANVQTVSAATEELSSSIHEISEQIARSSTMSQRAVSETEKSTETIQELANSVNKIGDVVNLISDIAEQTNLLALNATIEAARAGDAGKGFAVVASEVKELAGATAKATQEISDQISQVQTETKKVVGAIDSISSVIVDMDEISSSIAAAVEEQSSATSEISRNVEQASQGTLEVSESIVSVEASAGETGQAAEQIQLASSNLTEQSKELNSEIQKFLGHIRSSDGDLLEWSDDLLTHDRNIDKHHKEFVNKLNGYYNDMMSGSGPEAVTKMIRTINSDIIRHFAEEEKFMDKINYPAIEKHRKSHKEFMQQFEVRKKDVENNVNGAGTELFVYVAKWFKDHTFYADKCLASYCKDKNIRMS